MTIIAAVHVPGTGTWIGSDTMASFHDGDATTYNCEKWILRDDGYALGVSGSGAMLTALQHRYSSTTGSNYFMRTPFDFSRWLRNVMAGIGAKPKDSDGNVSWYDFTVLHAWPGGVYSLSSEGGAIMGEPNEIIARGSGMPYAVGAWWGSRNDDALAYPESRLEDSLACAIRWAGGCGGKPWVRLLK